MKKDSVAARVGPDVIMYLWRVGVSERGGEIDLGDLFSPFYFLPLTHFSFLYHFFLPRNNNFLVQIDKTRSHHLGLFVISGNSLQTKDSFSLVLKEGFVRWKADIVHSLWI